MSGTFHRGKEESLAAENGRFDATYELDVVIDGGLERHDAPGVDTAARDTVGITGCVARSGAAVIIIDAPG